MACEVTNRQPCFVYYEKRISTLLCLIVPTIRAQTLLTANHDTFLHVGLDAWSWWIALLGIHIVVIDAVYGFHQCKWVQALNHMILLHKLDWLLKIERVNRSGFEGTERITAAP